jgi:hypothetical protein
MRYQKIQTGTKLRIKAILNKNHCAQRQEDAHKEKMKAIGAVNPRLLKKEK